ncbi:ComEC/Rec2 family competence protein [Bacillus thuringiensis]|uniref:Metallo-beta-lactamase domain-containing protein n=1 Tax=Bacillus thuringiensis DB27 TaxID=1431339 RepID=W8Y8N3_BACTU|nr:ComEC/Rec2 family competence protein [Bacillus thuringiensis]MBG9628632.1 competence protein ComEC [Bacillus thuringiensis]MBG9664586.1 competence protein ComEC [Bacillus thuringiensis]MBH0354738.1 competence protein ComEC [Bacillus thuringiensis]CDN37833.1 unnamed protein product [Bacillus thuringiensis DB27]
MQEQWGYVAISFIIGVAIAFSSSLLLIVFCLFLNVFFCLYRTSRKTFIFCIVACFSSAIYTSCVQTWNKPLGESYGVTRRVIQNAPLVNGDRLSFQFEDQNKNIVQLSYRIKSVLEKKKMQQLYAGISCVFEGERKEPETARNFHGFNYRDYLYKQHIHFTFEATYISECYKTSLSLTQWILLLRQQAISKVTEMFPEQSGAFMNALLFGDRQQMTFEVEEQYQQFGLVHLLAISGSHIVMLMVIVYFILLRSGVTREVATICLIVCIPLYMVLAGASPSVIRASITGVLMLIAFMCSIRLSSLDALSVTAICMLIYDPYLVFNIGFQFSFVGSFALLLSAPLLLESSNGIIRNSIYISIISQLVSTPILLYHFGYFSPYSILLNLLYVPFLSIIVLPCSIIILLCMPIVPFLAKGFADVLSIGLSMSNDFLSYCESLPFTQLIFGETLRVNKEEWQQKKHEFSVGNDVLIPFLQKEGIKTIDKLIVTHGDADRIGAAQELLSYIPVKEVVFGRKGKDAVLEKVVKKRALEKEMKITEVGEGESWSVNEAEFFVLAPKGKEKSENNASIVIWAKFGGLKWLFTGDLEEEGEKILVEAYPDLQVDVLKVAHHGSNTSSIEPFLNVIQPRVAIISVGKQNRYGHPHKEVIERFEKMGSAIWRTDKQGAISYVFKGENGTFKSKITYDKTHNR